MIEGVVTALVTPFSADGQRLDIAAMEKLLQSQAEALVDGVVIGGATGEGATLAKQEYEQLLALALAKLPSSCKVIMGIGVNDTREAVALAKIGREARVSGLMVMSPPYNKPTQDGIVRHVAAVREASGLPIMLYNAPGRTAVNVLPSTVKRMLGEDVVHAVKEASGSVDQIGELLSQVPAGFPVLSGDDSLSLPLYVLGAKGTVSVASNFLPQPVRELYSLSRAGKYLEARELHFRLLPVFKALFVESNPIPVRAAMEILGRIPSGTPRLPLTPALASTRELLQRTLASWF